MVKLFTFWLLNTAFAQNPLSVNCHPSEIYLGETTVCEFMIAGNRPFAEVEVAKFPEFQGYWMENLGLRQGLLSLHSSSKGLYQTSIGTYALTPMLDTPEYRFLPMHVVVKGPSGESLFESPSVFLKLKPLPPVPKEYQRDFRGAVGDFKLIADSTTVSYTVNEPFSIHYILSGDGNYPDINRLSMSLPKGIEPVAQKSTTEGMALNYRKIFQMVLLAKRNDLNSLSLGQLVYFNPRLKRYLAADLPRVELHHSAGKPIDPYEPLGLRENWRPYRSWIANKEFWSVQLWLATLVALFMGFNFFWNRHPKRQDPGVAQRVRNDLARQALKMGNLDTFLRLATEHICETLSQNTGIPSTSPYPILLREARRNGVDPHFLDSASLLLQTHGTYFYSPDKRPLSNHQDLERAFEILLSSPSFASQKAG